MTWLLAESWLHTLDPFAIEFPASWQALPLVPEGIRWYGLAYIAGFLIAWLLIGWLARTGRALIAPQRVGDLMTAVIIGVIVGGRAGHVLFYEPQLFISFHDAFPFWGLLEINRGGMSSHGGMIGVIIAGLWFARRNRIAPLHLLDVAAFASPPGLALGRLANLVNAELWGRPLPDAAQSFVVGQGMTGAQPPWWSIKYPQEVVEVWLRAVNEPASHSPAVVEAAQQRLDLLIEKLSPLLGLDDGLWARIEQAARDVSRKDHDQVVSVLQPLLTAHYPSQVFQALTDGPMLMGLLALIWLRPRKPGVVGAWFLIGYGALRLTTEQFRAADEGVFAISAATLPMLLSAGMIVVGAWLGWSWSRRDAAPVGGLLRRA
jgi:phosphatidylglycerol:prolipoprotein diacylglycerol transferase